MSELRFGIFDRSTGRLQSLMSEEQKILPPRMESVAFDPPFDLRIEMWDEAARRRTPRPTKTLRDVYDDVLASFKTKETVLSPAQEAVLKETLADVIGTDSLYNAATGWQKR